MNVLDTLRRFVPHSLRTQETEQKKESPQLWETPGTYSVLSIRVSINGGMRDGYLIEAYGSGIRDTIHVNRFTVIPKQAKDLPGVSMTIPENMSQNVIIHTQTGVIFIDKVPYRTNQKVDINHYAGFGPSDQMEQGEWVRQFPSRLQRRRL